MPAPAAGAEGKAKHVAHATAKAPPPSPPSPPSAPPSPPSPPTSPIATSPARPAPIFHGHGSVRAAFTFLEAQCPKAKCTVDLGIHKGDWADVFSKTPGAIDDYKRSVDACVAACHM